MKRHWVIMLLAAGLAAVSTNAGAAKGANLLENPSFEKGGRESQGKLPPHWIKDTLSQQDVRRSPASKSTVVVAAGGRTGRYKAVMTLDESDKWMYMEQRWKVKKIKRGRQFAGSVWLRADKAIDAQISVAAYCHSMKKAFSGSAGHKLTDLWRQYDVRITIADDPSGATRVEEIPGGGEDYVRVVIQIHTPGTGVEVDDVRLVRFAPGRRGFVKEKAPVVKAPDGDVRPAGPGKWLEPTDELETPHIKWMRPAGGGALKVLFITYRVGMRGIVEICQRFDIEREVFAFERPTVFAGDVPPVQFKVFAGTDPPAQEKRLREKLALDYDCIVIGNVPWKAFPEWARKSILEKVASGTGLTGYINGEYDAALGAIVAKKLDADPESILGAFPFGGLPAFEKYESLDAFAAGTLDVAQHGKGRIAILKGYPCTTYQMVAPAITSSFADWHTVHYDYYLALAGRLMKWTSKRAPEVLVAGDGERALRVDRTELSEISFGIEAEGAGSADVAFALRHGKSGDVVETAERSVALKSGRTDVSFEMPALPAGGYFADLWVRRRGKTLTFGSRFVEITSKSRISDVVLVGDDFGPGDTIKNYSQKDAITGSVSVAGSRAGLAVEVDQRDNYGRVVARARFPLEGAGESESIAFALRPPTPLSVLQDIEVALMEGEVVLDRHRETFAYNDLFAWDDDVHYIIWEGYSGDAYVNPALHKVIRDAGITLFWLGYDYGAGAKRVVDASVLRAGMHVLSTLFGPRAGASETIRMRPYREPEPAPGGGYIRTPCVSDPDYLKRSADIRAEAFETTKKFSTRHFTVGSELSLTHNQREVCFGPECIRAFREYLRREYGAIEKLNEEYDSTYGDWSEITPVPYEKAIETGQIPLWIDFRRSMDGAWAKQFALIKERASEVVPGAKIGCDASNDPGHTPKLGGLGGDDYWQLTKNMSLSGPYFWPPQLDCVRDFADPGTLIGGGWFGGYSGLFRAHRHGPWHRWLIWYTFLRGANSFWLWQGSGGRAGHLIGTTIAPDFTWYDFMSDGIAAVNDIQEGIGKLAMAMRRDDDGVAVLYSQASMLMANFTPEFPKRWDSWAALTVILPESNFQYRMIASEQLERGILREGGIRVLYLPYSQALSAKEVEEVRAFVEGGGSVVADLRPAVTDEHGKPYASGALDDVFGVIQNTTMPAPVEGSVVLPEPVGEAEDYLPMTHADASLKLAAGAALGRVKNTPAVIVNDFGEGKAVLFNFAISDYILNKLMYGSNSLIRFVDDEAATKTAKFVRGVFERCRLTPAVTMTPQTPGCHLYRFTSGDVTLMGLLQEAAPFLPGVGAKPRAQLEQIDQRTSEVTLVFGETRHVYDVLAGKYLGDMNSVDRTVSPTIPHLLVTLPYKVEAVSVEPADDTLSQGEELSFDATVETDGTEPGLHVLRIELTDPDGETAGMYTQKVKAEGGKYAGSIALSFNEKPGDWKLTARDVATGVAGTTTFQVRESSTK